MRLGGVAVDYMTKNQRVEKREDLVGRRQQESGHKKLPVLFRILVQKIHRRQAQKPKRDKRHEQCELDGGRALSIQELTCGNITVRKVAASLESLFLHQL